MLDPKSAEIIVAVLGAASICWSAAYAWTRWLTRPGVAPRSAEHEQRLLRIEQALDAMAIEVERIGEGQRFANRLLAERAPTDDSLLRAPAEHQRVPTPS